MIKSFRGQIPHAGTEQIRLSTNDGLTGYKIKKFQLLQTDANENVESTVKVFSIQPDPAVAVSGTLDFNDPTILAAAMYWASTAQADVHENIVVFDNTVVNQDIFITHYDYGFAAAINYYIELEQVKLDLNEATVATLKDMRGRE